MTTVVTVKHAGVPVYVYEAHLDENQSGEFKLTAEVTEGERIFYVHSSLDLLVTENKLDE